MAGFDLDAISAAGARATRDTYGQHGRASGVSPGGAVSPRSLVCTSDGYAPPLYVPAEEPARDVLEVDAKMQKLFVEARAAREPKRMRDLQERSRPLSQLEEQALRDLLFRKRDLTAVEKAQLSALSERSRGLTPNMVQELAKLEKKSASVASAQDRVADILSIKGSVVATNKAKTSWMSGGAIAIEKSGNQKIKGFRNTMTTYASISHTCPLTCLQRGVSCYGETSNNIRPIILMLEHVANVLGHSPEEVAEDEARAIDASFVEGVDVPTDLRIHTVGDCRSPESVRTVASAAVRWMQRSVWQKFFGNRLFAGVPSVAWTYTHGWNEHRREDWGPVGILASVQTVGQIELATKAGWAKTIVVPKGFYKKPRVDPATKKKIPFFDENGAPIPFKLEGVSTEWIPCPAQNPKKSLATGCVNCRICFDDRALFERNQGVAFEAHAAGKVSGVPFKHGEFVVAHANAMKGLESRDIRPTRKRALTVA